MTDASDEVARRAAARAGWAGRLTTLAASDGEEDLSATTTPEQRLAMMWELALGAWSLTGQPFPTYTRAEMPCRIIRAAGR